ncbi:IEC3 subunit of the Ino80 complex, chromatin re-modelling-domain-containing protein [Trichophaea hybrida]|nr:IEC3 subunit of the Ino80 complex, chromatin re-modelling-domain-containing protein [Trichophaea hybrida]
MSTASVNGGVAEDRAHQKSFKRKYRKLRHNFKEVMKRSDELFKQEQLAKQAIRRMQEENTRILDFLVDLNESEHIPKERRHNIGSPSHATPPRFLSPTLLANIYGGDPSFLEDFNGDVEEMNLDAEAARRGEQNGGSNNNNNNGNNNNDNNSNNNSNNNNNNNSSDDEDEEEGQSPASQGSKFNSDDEDDKEAYLEEIREFNYKRGIAGTPPRSVREKMKADAQRERKEAEEDAKKAAAEVAAAKKDNDTGNSAAVPIKQEKDDDEEVTMGDGDAPQNRPPLVVEEYRRGHTPEYLRSGSPFLMTLEEEEEWYDEIHDKYDGGIPPIEHPNSPSAAKAEGDPRNPMSVYCWLRKNQPQVFLQGEEVEGGGKKPGRGRGGNRRKAVEVDSGDEGAVASIATKSEPGKLAGAKRRRTMTNGSETLSVPSALGSAGGRGRGSGMGTKGGRKKAEGSPPVKRQRR